MNDNQFVDNFIKLFSQFKESLFQFLPNVVASLLIFLAGLLFASLIKILTERFINQVHHLIPNKNIQTRIKRFIAEKPVSPVIGSVLYWIIVFFFLTAATEALGLPVVTTWLSGVADYLPRILAAVLIGIAGIIGGIIVRDIIVTTTASTGFIYGETLGKLANITIILVTVIIGIEQVGIDITLLTSLLTIIIGGLLFGATLAFGLGARTSVSNILASYYLKKTYQVGHMVTIGDKKGRIVRITPVAVILDATDGQVYIPAAEFSETASTLVTKEEEHGI
jgi:small-conductance mechanosensitive channel